MFWIFFFPNTLYKKSLPPPCAASRTGPLRVVAGRARLTLGILSRSVQSAALTLRTRCFGDVVQRGRQHPHAFLRRSLLGRSCFPPWYKPGSPGSLAQWTRPEKAYAAKNSKAARPKRKCCRVEPSPLRILTIIGRVMRRRGGAVGRHSPGLIPCSLVFIELLTVPCGVVHSVSPRRF